MKNCIECGSRIEDYFERCYNCYIIRKINRKTGSINLNPDIKIKFMKQMGIEVY